MKRVCDLAAHEAGIARVHVENIVSVLKVKADIQEGDNLTKTLRVIQVMEKFHEQLSHMERRLEELKKVDV